MQRRRAALWLAVLLVPVALAGACGKASKPTPTSDPAAEAQALAAAAEERLTALPAVAEAEVDAYPQPQQDAPATGTEPTPAPQEFLIDASVTFPADAVGEPLLEAVSQIREILTDGAGDGGTVVLDSLTLEHQANRGHSARWSTTTAGQNIDAEAELWARLIDSTTVASVHVWHDEGELLTIEALAPAVEGQPTSGELYSDVVEMCELSGVDVAGADVLVWTGYALESAGGQPLREPLLTALDRVAALPAVATIQAFGAPSGMKVVVYPQVDDETNEPAALTDSGRAELLAQFEAEGVLDEDLVVRVVTNETAPDGEQVWPIA